VTQKMVLASGNEGKLREIRELLKDLPIELVSQKALGIESPEESGTTFVENAIIKARHAAKVSRLPAIADDSGLMLEALDGQPGVYTACFGGEGLTPAERVTKLLEAMGGKEDRRITFYCTTVLMVDADDPAPIICQGAWEGEVLHEPQGSNGFGYDPIFYVKDHGCSAAELSAEIKNRLSHRGQAFAQLRGVLEHYFELESTS